jgi:hypothetical protein
MLVARRSFFIFPSFLKVSPLQGNPQREWIVFHPPRPELQRQVTGGVKNGAELVQQSHRSADQRPTSGKRGGVSTCGVAGYLAGVMGV